MLPSGAVLLVENLPSSKVVSVQLFASAKGVRETPQTHGWRHLLEHLLVKGPDKGLAERLETQGIFLTADTHRDAMQLALLAPAAKLDLALETVRIFLQPLQTTQSEIDNEVKVLGEELALAPSSKRLSKMLWAASMGDQALDPIGDPKAMATATPELLEMLRRRHFAPQNLVLVVSGPLDVDKVTLRAKALLPAEKGPFEPDPVHRSAGSPAVAREGGREARAVPAPGWGDRNTAANLVAAFALASELKDGYVIYTPSVQPGLILLGSNDDGLGAYLQGLKPAEIDALFPRGRTIAESWLRRQLDNSEGSAALRGLLYVQGIGSEPEDLLDNIRRVSQTEYRAAVDLFRTEGKP